MREDRSSGSRLEAAVETVGSAATDAFALLGNETRLAILLSLWEVYDPGSDDNALRFSELYDRVDYDNAGNFSYHLEKLSGQFVRKHDDCYELRKTGLKLVQSIIAGAGIEKAVLEPTEIDLPCTLCGASTAISYRDGGVYQTCTECAGIAPERDLPDGYLNAMKLHPAALTDRSPEELFAAAGIAAHRHIRTMYEGLCSECSGPIDATLDACTDHDADGTCQNCGREYAFWTQFECRVCKDYHVTTPAVVSLFHPAVVAFYEDHGVSTQVHAADFESVARIMDLYTDHEMKLDSEDPPRVTVTVALEGDELAVTFDEAVRVVDVRR